MKYKCLVLDHDDTIVDSTASIHYPCFAEYLKIWAPELVGNYTFESYIVKNFHPGVMHLFLVELGMTEAEFDEEQKFWEEYVKTHIPTAFSGIGELMRDFKRAGGIIAVDSHSLTHNIKRDFEHNSLPMPDIIYGWDIPKEKRKPAPDTIFDLMERYSLSPSDILVVDDLKPGLDMARAAGVSFAAAGWAYDVPEIEKNMREKCDFYLKSINELRALLFSE